MPHLSTARRKVWERLWAEASRIDREIDNALRREWAIPLGWFEVMNGLREAGGRARPLELAELVGVPASTLSRRLDRLEEEGWIQRDDDTSSTDARAVEVYLTQSGRRLWREMNVSYRRVLQEEFARHLTESELTALDSIIERLGAETDPPPPDPE